jgi:hypothetical protein
LANEPKKSDAKIMERVTRDEVNESPRGRSGSTVQTAERERERERKGAEVRLVEVAQ